MLLVILASVPPFASAEQFLFAAGWSASVFRNEKQFPAVDMEKPFGQVARPGGGLGAPLAPPGNGGGGDGGLGGGPFVPIACGGEGGGGGGNGGGFRGLGEGGGGDDLTDRGGGDEETGLPATMHAKRLSKGI
jgi:hypothetical protein